MSLFKKNDYKNKQKSLNNTSTSEERIEFLIYESENQIPSICHNLRDNIPYVINFEEANREDANLSLAYLSGFVHALKGKTLKIDDSKFMFATDEAFLDGTLYTFIKFIHSQNNQ